MTGRQYTERGFAVYAEFLDTYRSLVKVQQSSSAHGPRVWIFATFTEIQLKPEVSERLAAAGFRTPQQLAELAAFLEPSPHLDVDQAKAVRDALDEFIRENEAAAS